MTARAFVDTDVLVYADDREAGVKGELARTLLRQTLADRRTVLSMQVLQECFAAATRKLGLPVEAARRRVALLGRLDVVTPGPDDLLAAIDLHRLHAVSFWDALIVRAALVAGCRILYSEISRAGSDSRRSRS